MKLSGTIGHGVIGLMCMVALALSIYPGVLNNLVFVAIMLSFIGLPIMAIVGAIILGWFAWRGRLRCVTIPWTHVGAALLLLLGTYTLLKFYVPRRIAFAASRSAFERHFAQTAQPENGPALLNRRLGVYQVDQYSVDPRGGTYWRVYSGADGIGPDVMSYGFCYNPNSKGSPFGAAHYRTFRLSDGWYWFRASDDWY